MDFSVGLLMILLIPLIIFIFVLCWISDIAKNTRTM